MNRCGDDLVACHPSIDLLRKCATNHQHRMVILNTATNHIPMRCRKYAKSVVVRIWCASCVDAASSAPAAVGLLERYAMSSTTHLVATAMWWMLLSNATILTTDPTGALQLSRTDASSATCSAHHRARSVADCRIDVSINKHIIPSSNESQVFTGQYQAIAVFYRSFVRVRESE
jgi:hypothetical protein